MPSYGGKTSVTYKCYMPFLFALGQWKQFGSQTYPVF